MKKVTREKIKRIVAIACAVLVIMAFLSSIIMPYVFAAGTKDLEAAEAKTKQAKKDLDAAESKKEAAVAEYNALDQQITDTESEISILETTIQETESEIEAQEAALEIAEKEYQDYQEIFKKRARTMYENTDMDYLEILFSAESFSDFLAKINIVSSIITYDRDVLTDMQETKQLIINTKAELEANLEMQQENMATLEESRAFLSSSLSEKEALIAEISKDVEKYKAVYEAAEASEQALIRNSSSALSYSANPIKYTGGKFAWPVPSTQRISSYYGYRIHPIYKVKKFHSGIDISAAYGVDIVAAADGTVTMSATNGGYGKCIIINHGSGISTLYGHNSSLLVSNGAKVTKGQVIAKAGSTGLSTGPHLHFEVRINGSAVDPLSYYK